MNLNLNLAQLQQKSELRPHVKAEQADEVKALVGEEGSGKNPPPMVSPRRAQNSSGAMVSPRVRLLTSWDGDHSAVLNMIVFLQTSVKLPLAIPVQRDERDSTREEIETGTLSPRRRKASQAGPLQMASPRRASAASENADASASSTDAASPRVSSALLRWHSLRSHGFIFRPAWR